MVVAVAVVSLVCVAPGRIGAQADPRVYAPPVDAPVIDPFRPPARPWLPGNRGLEYATVPGAQVRAIGPGTVVFAGPVAGQRYVTVAHPDGLRSSYSYLAVVRVGVGDPVGAGDVVGIAADRFHIGVRRGDTYLDPASLWGQRVSGGRVRLVPNDGGHSSVEGSLRPPGPPEGDEATGFRSVASFGSSVAHLGIEVSRAVDAGVP